MGNEPDYITEQMDILGISDFEKKSRKLSTKTFANPDCKLLSGDEI